MTPKAQRDKIQQSIYLEPEKADLLDQMAEHSGVPKAKLLREAVDDLLAKYEWHRERRPDGRGNIHTLKRKKPKA